MGKGLADDITRGKATGDMFRTTPLWGVGQRSFFLYGGRTADLLQAIEAHMLRGGGCTGPHPDAPSAGRVGCDCASAVNG
jgi:CxxC motif-containing protein (DUF1111 family)